MLYFLFFNIVQVIYSAYATERYDYNEHCVNENIFSLYDIIDTSDRSCVSILESKKKVYCCFCVAFCAYVNMVLYIVLWEVFCLFFAIICNFLLHFNQIKLSLSHVTHSISSSIFMTVFTVYIYSIWKELQPKCKQ